MDDADGHRIHATVELVSRLTASVGGLRFWRLLVTGAQTPSHLLVDPSYNEFPLPEQTGGTYRVSNAVLITKSLADANELGHHCPECGGQVRSGIVLDAIDDAVRAGMDTFDVPVPFLLVDAETSITRDRGNGGSESVELGEPIHAPSGVCTACGTVVKLAADC